MKSVLTDSQEKETKLSPILVKLSGMSYEDRCRGDAKNGGMCDATEAQTACERHQAF